MYSSFVIFGLWVVCIMIDGGGHCETFEPGTSYSWIIPPQSQPSSHLQDTAAATFDTRNQSPITHIGGYGHPPFNRRYSHEQLSLPNEFLITPSDPHKREGPSSSSGSHSLSSTPLFKQLEPVDCDGGQTRPNVDITQQQHPTRIHQSNIASVPANAPPSEHHQQRSSPPPAALGQPVSWPSSHGGGIGLLFFVPESASRLPVEQLIRQQLALHRTQFPFDISINCEDAFGSGCRPDGGGGLSLPRQSPPPSTTTLNGRNVENGNYARLPLVEIDNSSNRRGSQPKWRTIGERIVQYNQHQNILQQQLLQQQQQQFQLNQRELSIDP